MCFAGQKFWIIKTDRIHKFECFFNCEILCIFQDNEDNEAAEGLYSMLSLEHKRSSEDFIFRRPLSK